MVLRRRVYWNEESWGIIFCLDGDDFGAIVILKQIASELRIEHVDAIIFGYSYYYDNEIKESVSQLKDPGEATNFCI